MQRAHVYPVKYAFYSPKQGGRQTLPIQGYMPNFAYAQPDRFLPEVYMARAQFLNSAGDHLELGQVADPTGIVNLEIVLPEMADFHRERLIASTKIWFTEGARIIGEGLVLG